MTMAMLPIVEIWKIDILSTYTHTHAQRERARQRLSEHCACTHTHTHTHKDSHTTHSIHWQISSHHQANKQTQSNCLHFEYISTPISCAFVLIFGFVVVFTWSLAVHTVFLYAPCVIFRYHSKEIKQLKIRPKRTKTTVSNGQEGVGFNFIIAKY